jgi:hypothetical protein
LASAHELVVQGVEKRLELRALLDRHRVTGERLARRLELAASEDLRNDSYLVERAPEVAGLDGGTQRGDAALRRKDDARASEGQQHLPRSCPERQMDDQPLVRRAEREKRLAQGGHGGRAGAERLQFEE